MRIPVLTLKRPMSEGITHHCPEGVFNFDSLRRMPSCCFQQQLRTRARPLKATVLVEMYRLPPGLKNEPPGLLPSKVSDTLILSQQRSGDTLGMTFRDLIKSLVCLSLARIRHEQEACVE